MGPASRGRLEGKVVFITGTAGGQGRAAAQLFAAHGARVMGCDVHADGAEETVRLVTAARGTMHSLHPLDLSSPDAVRRWIETGVSQLGGIDVLYNNAGAVRFTAVDAPDAADAWRFTLTNELDIVFATTSAAWPHLVQRGGGSIINTSSAAAVRGLPLAIGRPGSSAAHGAAKAGVLGLTRQIACEGAPHGIRANAIVPGLIESPVTAPLIADARMREALLRSNLIKRVGQPQDTAYAALFLASDEASYVTGTSIVVDGGFSARGGYFDVDPIR